MSICLKTLDMSVLKFLVNLWVRFQTQAVCLMHIVRA